MLKPILVLFIFAFAGLRCSKNCESEKCLHPNLIPQPAYPQSITETEYNESHCGLMPLSKENFWVYLDSMFDNGGQFLNTRIDTLRFTKTFKTPDNIIWWEPTVPLKLKGLFRFSYSTDSVLYTIVHPGTRAIRWLYTLNADSAAEYCPISDTPSYCYATKINDPLVTPAGIFTECISFTKIWVVGDQSFKIDFKPGVGIVRFEQFKWSFTTPPITVQKSTLQSYYLQ